MMEDCVMNKKRFAALLSTLMAFIIATPTLAADIWNIKCFSEDGHAMAVKAIGPAGVTYDVKALMTANSDRLDVKAIPRQGGDKLAVKVVPSKQGADYSDIKAITKANKLLPVKAISSTGDTLGVKAFKNSATDRFDIKCLSVDGDRLGLKAISPSGEVYNVKGIPDLPGEEIEIEIEAHIKALPR